VRLPVLKGFHDRAFRASFGTALVSLEAMVSLFRRKDRFELPVVSQELEVTVLDGNVTGGLLKEGLVFVMEAIVSF